MLSSLKLYNLVYKYKQITFLIVYIPIIRYISNAFTKVQNSYTIYKQLLRSYTTTRALEAIFYQPQQFSKEDYIILVNSKLLELYVEYLSIYDKKKYLLAYVIKQYYYQLAQKFYRTNSIIKVEIVDQIINVNSQLYQLYFKVYKYLY